MGKGKERNFRPDVSKPRCRPTARKALNARFPAQPLIDLGNVPWALIGNRQMMELNLPRLIPHAPCLELHGHTVLTFSSALVLGASEGRHIWDVRICCV